MKYKTNDDTAKESEPTTGNPFSADLLPLVKEESSQNHLVYHENRVWDLLSNKCLLFLYLVSVFQIDVLENEGSIPSSTH